MTKNLIAAIGIAAILTAGACRSATPAVHTPQASAPSQPSAPAQTLPDSLRWVRDSAEYRAAALQTYRAASTSVAAAAGGHKPGSWAVVLDADETVISNLQYQIERAQARQPYRPESWRAWVVFVGDNILDFPGLTQAVAKSKDAALEPFGTKFCMVPNPMYGSWQQ